MIWRFEGGTLRFVANFGDTAREAAIGESGAMIWTSPSVERQRGRAGLPPWTGFFVREAAR